MGRFRPVRYGWKADVGGRVKGIRFETLDAICTWLDWQPGDLLVHEKDAGPSAWWS